MCNQLFFIHGERAGPADAPPPPPLPGAFFFFFFSRRSTNVTPEQSGETVPARFEPRPVSVSALLTLLISWPVWEEARVT